MDQKFEVKMIYTTMNRWKKDLASSSLSTRTNVLEIEIGINELELQQRRFDRT